MERYIDQFKAEDIDFIALAMVDENRLTELGITKVGPKMKMRTLISSFQNRLPDVRGMSNIDDLLHAYALDKFIKTFREQEIEIETLTLLDEDAFEELGLTKLGEKIKIQALIQSWTGGGNGGAEATVVESQSISTSNSNRGNGTAVVESKSKSAVVESKSKSAVVESKSKSSSNANKKKDVEKYDSNTSFIPTSMSHHSGDEIQMNSFGFETNAHAPMQHDYKNDYSIEEIEPKQQEEWETTTKKGAKQAAAKAKAAAAKAESEPVQATGPVDFFAALLSKKSGAIANLNSTMGLNEGGAIYPPYVPKSVTEGNIEYTLVPHRLVGTLIGLKGSVVSKIYKDTQCKVKILQENVPDGVDRKVCYVGTPAQMAHAKKLVIRVLIEGPTILNGPNWTAAEAAGIYVPTPPPSFTSTPASLPTKVNASVAPTPSQMSLGGDLQNDSSAPVTWNAMERQEKDTAPVAASGAQWQDIWACKVCVERNEPSAAACRKCGSSRVAGRVAPAAIPAVGAKPGYVPKQQPAGTQNWQQKQQHQQFQAQPPTTAKHTHQQPHQAHAHAQQPQQQVTEITTEVMLVPQQKVSGLIGVHGAVIRSITKISGCRSIKVQTSEVGVGKGSFQKVNILGQATQIAVAKYLIQKVIEEGPEVVANILSKQSGDALPASLEYSLEKQAEKKAQEFEKTSGYQGGFVKNASDEMVCQKCSLLNKAMVSVCARCGSGLRPTTSFNLLDAGANTKLKKKK